MKTLLNVALLSCLITVSHAATTDAKVGPHSSWAKIFSDKSLIVHTPYSGIFGPLGVFNTCASDTQLIAISPVNVCIEYDYVPAQNSESYPDQYNCKTFELQIPTMPRTFTEHRCVAQDMTEGHYPECLQWSDVTTTVPTRMSIEVMHASSDVYAGTVFYKDFTIPSCPEKKQ